MTEEQREAQAVEAMHQQWAVPVAGVAEDDDDEPMTWEAPTPTADELARARVAEAVLAAAIVELEAVLFDLPKYRKMTANEAKVYERRAWKARAGVVDAVRAARAAGAVGG